jgi:hypothetical protein
LTPERSDSYVIGAIWSTIDASAGPGAGVDGTQGSKDVDAACAVWLQLALERVALDLDVRWGVTGWYYAPVPPAAAGAPLPGAGSDSWRACASERRSVRAATGWDVSLGLQGAFDFPVLAEHILEGPDGLAIVAVRRRHVCETDIYNI